MPVVAFGGRVVVIQTAAEAKKAVDFLLTQSILGIDTETRPSFRKGVHYKVALLQVSTRDICFLFRLNMIDLTDDILRLLSAKEVQKIGLSLHDDIQMLHQRGECSLENYVELQDFVHTLGVKDQSLQKLFANVFRQKISKAQRLTNWEAPVLNDKQKIYAATDAWACVVLYDELQQLKETGAYELIKNPETNTNLNN